MEAIIFSSLRDKYESWGSLAGAAALGVRSVLAVGLAALLLHLQGLQSLALACLSVLHDVLLTVVHLAHVHVLSRPIEVRSSSK